MGEVSILSSSALGMIEEKERGFPWSGALFLHQHPSIFASKPRPKLDRLTQRLVAGLMAKFHMFL